MTTLFHDGTSAAYPDLELQEEGTIVLFHPRTDRGASWICDNVDLTEAQFFGQALAVEPGFAAGIAEGATRDGLVITRS